MHPELEHIREVALTVAHEAGKILMEKFRRLDRIEKKGSVDLVTEADLASEAAVVAMLREAFPEHAILAEEGDYADADTAVPRWVIDPLDGTTNYVHGLPLFGVSIGYQVGGDTMAAVVFNPAMDETFCAVKGNGAYLNGLPIHVSDTATLDDALLVTGFPYAHDEVFYRSFDLYRELYDRCRGVRRLGAAALDLCFMAAGRFDAFYEAHLHPWDICAGDLIVREAGGHTSDWRNGPLPFDGRRVLASNGRIHQEMLDVMAGEDFADLI